MMVPFLPAIASAVGATGAGAAGGLGVGTIGSAIAGTLGSSILNGIGGGLEAGLQNRIGQGIGGEPTPYINFNPTASVGVQRRQLAMEQARASQTLAEYQAQSSRGLNQTSFRQSVALSEQRHLQELERMQVAAQNAQALAVLQSRLQVENIAEAAALEKANRPSLGSRIRTGIFGTDDRGRPDDRDFIDWMYRFFSRPNEQLPDPYYANPRF